MPVEHAIATMRLDPLVPVWALAALGILCLVVLAVAVWRRARGAVWRGLAFAVLLLWLAGPRLVQETRQTRPDIGLLVVDQTASMQIGNRAALTDATRAAIEAQAAKLPDLELRTVTVPEEGNAGTRLFATIDRALANIPQAQRAGVIAITDGQVHDAPPPPADGKDPASSVGGGPLQVLIPAAGEQTDRRIRVIEAPSYGIVGRPVTLRIAIEDLGPPPAGHAAPSVARLTIRRDGDPPRIESVPVGREHSIELPITRAGPTVVELSADALPGEISTINNRAVVAINGVRDRLRVLLISGEPHSGERTWRRLLRADPAVDLVHFTILRPPEKDDLTPLNELALIAFPVRELFQVKIKEFDLIILDRFQNRGLLPLPYLRNIADYVTDGGALLLSVGPEFAGPSSLAATPIGDVLPGRPPATNGVVEGGFRPVVTPLGLRHPVTEDLEGANTVADPSRAPAWGPWYRRITSLDDHGETLMSAPDGSPLLLLDRVGKGRTALLLSDQIWLWSRGHQGGGPQAELLRRIAHWLMKEPELEENALVATVEGGRLRIERRSTDPAAPPDATVTDPDGHARTVPLTPTEPGHATASLPAALPGVWQVAEGGQVAYAAAGAANPAEIADLRATASILGKLAQASGGGVQWLDDGTGNPRVPTLVRTEADHDASGPGWIGLQRRHDHIVTGIASVPLLPPWAALPLLLGLIVIGWRREGS